MQDGSTVEAELPLNCYSKNQDANHCPGMTGVPASALQGPSTELAPFPVLDSQASPSGMNLTTGNNLWTLVNAAVVLDTFQVPEFHFLCLIIILKPAFWARFTQPPAVSPLVCEEA